MRVAALGGHTSVLSVGGRDRAALGGVCGSVVGGCIGLQKAASVSALVVHILGLTVASNSHRVASPTTSSLSNRNIRTLNNVLDGNATLHIEVLVVAATIGTTSCVECATRNLTSVDIKSQFDTIGNGTVLWVTNVVAVGVEPLGRSRVHSCRHGSFQRWCVRHLS